MNIASLTNTIFENIPNSNGKFTKHFHNTYTIGLTHDGMFKSINEKQSTLSYKYSTRVINPNEIHHGDSTSWKYTNFYPEVELLIDMYEQIFLEKKIPIFTTHIIQDSIELINDTLSMNLSLDDLAQNSSLSKYHFLRVFKKHTGLTPHQYILSTRINKVKNLIIKGETPINASLNAGFNDQSHFIRNFRNMYGYSPKILQEKSNFILYK